MSSSQSVDAKPQVSALVALDDEDAFRRSLVGVEPTPGFDIEESYVLVGSLPLPRARGPLPSRQSKAPVELQVAASRLVESFRELFQAYALERETFVARWDAFLAGRGDQPIADIPSLSERANIRNDLLFRVLADTELAVVALTPLEDRITFAVRFDLLEGSESASFAAIQTPEAPAGLERLDASLRSRVWSNLRLPRTPELRSRVIEALSSSLGLDRQIVDEQPEGRRVIGISTIWDTTQFESVEWPDDETVAIREWSRELQENQKSPEEQSTRTLFERDVSKLGEVPVDRLTTYLLDPDTGASLQEIERYFAWTTEAVYTAFSVGAESGSGFDRLRRLLERDSANTPLEKLLPSTPDELVLVSLFDAGAWDQQIRHLVPESLESLPVSAEPALFLHATTSSNRVEIGGSVDLGQMALIGNRSIEVARIAERYYGSGLERLRAGDDGGKADAAEWFVKAARLGNLDAQVELANLYWSGEGVHKDRGESFRRYAFAANRGHVGAQVAMGNIYFYGYERERDYEEALAWYRIAALQNDPSAQQKLGIAYADGWGVERDHAAAARWYRKAAERDIAGAQRALGELYLSGRGVTRDEAAGMEWFRKAAENNNSTAAAYFGWGLVHGVGVEKDPEEGVRWLRFSAEKGNARGQVGLAESYEHGWGVEQDWSQSFLWYSRAADQGNELAQLRLGVLYLSGNGVAKNLVESYRWLLLASRNTKLEPMRKQAEGFLPVVAKELSSEDLEKAIRLAESFVPSWKR